jgi:hypothetical protein
MNWIKVAARLERGALDMMDHAREVKKQGYEHRFDTCVAVAMCLAELARALAAGITESDQLIHRKETEAEQNK